MSIVRDAATELLVAVCNVRLLRCDEQPIMVFRLRELVVIEKSRRPDHRNAMVPGRG
jgi:hypothetical protein